MPKHRLNLFQLPTAKVADELRAATPRVNDAERKRLGRARQAAAKRNVPRSVTIDETLLPSEVRATLSNGQTAYRDDNGEWRVRRSEKKDLGYNPLGKKWLRLCETAYRAVAYAAQAESAPASDAADSLAAMLEPSSRDRGLELLAATTRYDIPVVLSESNREILVTGIVVRCRRLLRAAFALADDDMELEALNLIRTLTEYAILLAWLRIDFDYHVARWVIRDTDDRFKIDREVRKVDPCAKLLTTDTKQFMTERRDGLIAIVGERDLRLPSWKEMADDAEDDGLEGLRAVYALPYRADSQAAVHATVWAIDKLMELHPQTGGVIINPNFAPSRRQVDVYSVGASMLGMVLELGFDILGDDRQRRRVAEISERIPSPERPPE